MTELPAGFIDLGTHACHVAKVWEHTTDVHRFMRYLPLARELQYIDAGTPEAVEVMGRADDVLQLLVTCEEMAAMMYVGAEELRSAQPEDAA